MDTYDGTASGSQGGWPQTQMSAIGTNLDLGNFYLLTTGANWRNSEALPLQYEVLHILEGIHISSY